MGVESATYISDLNTSWPLVSDLKSQGDDHLRLLKSVLQTNFPGNDVPFYTSADRTDVASAGTCDIGAVASQYVNITGTTTITALGTCNAGVWRMIRFNAALTLTHNATSLILPGGANITTVAGDEALAFSRGSGNWTVLFYQRVSAAPFLGQATTSAIGAVELATDAETVTGTDTARVSPVSSLVRHEGVCKAWAYVNSAGTIQDSYGVTSVVKSGTGTYDVTLSVTMANALYAVITGPTSEAVPSTRVVSKTATTLQIQTEWPHDGSNADAAFSFAIFGTLA